jgi:hypothetical protein
MHRNLKIKGPGRFLRSGESRAYTRCEIKESYQEDLNIYENYFSIHKNTINTVNILHHYAYLENNQIERRTAYHSAYPINNIIRNGHTYTFILYQINALISHESGPTTFSFTLCPSASKKLEAELTHIL